MSSLSARIDAVERQHTAEHDAGMMQIAFFSRLYSDALHRYNATMSRIEAELARLYAERAATAPSPPPPLLVDDCE